MLGCGASSSYHDHRRTYVYAALVHVIFYTHGASAMGAIMMQLYNLLACTCIYYIRRVKLWSGEILAI